MRDLTQKVNAFYSAAAKASPEQTALKACNIIFGAFSKCDDVIDRQTGDFLPVCLLELAGAIRKVAASGDLEAIDRIGYMAAFLRDAIYEILRNPREEIIRTHQTLPQQRAKSFDQTSIRWLIRRPGATIAQKCALSRRVLAVKREFVPDTLENRLFKEFVRQFVPLLQCFLTNCRQDNRFQEETQLLNAMKKWLRDDAEAIRPWRNLPPNNTLLGNKQYRKIWDAWRKLADFSETLDSDVSSAPSYRRQILFLCIVNRLRDFGVRFAPIPAKMNLSHGKFDWGGNFEFADNEIHGIYIYDLKKIVPLALASNDCILIRISSRVINIRVDDINHIDVDGRVFQCSGLDFLPFIDNILIPKIIFGAKLRKFSVQEDHSTANEHISVDLNDGRPTFCSNGEKVRYSSFFIARQYWNFSGEIFSLPLKEAEACFCSELCETRLISDFWHNEYPMGDTSRTAADFAKDIYECFSLKKCAHTLLLPDMLDEMSDSAQILKRAFDIEDAERRADWLPTSIGALFALQGTGKFVPAEGLVFCFIERFGGTCSITSVAAKKTSFSPKLQNLLPESCGLIWERHPTVKITAKNDNAAPLGRFRSIAPIPVKADRGPWTLPGKVHHDEFLLSVEQLQQSLPTDNGECRIVLLSNGISLPYQYRDMAVALDRQALPRGAEILHTMQQKCPQYPLWTDDLPKLLVTAPDRNKKLRTYPLVSDDHDPVKTGRGQTTQLTTGEIRFTLHQGQQEPYIDLHRGEGRNRESYRVRLHLKTPPAEDILCRLNLYYTYGASNPYSLKFTPDDPGKAGFASIEGEPQSFHDDSNAFAAPEFPPLQKWDGTEKTPLNFANFFERNLGDFQYFASFASNEEIICMQKKISFVGHGGRAVSLLAAEEGEIPNAKPIKCWMNNFADPKCYDFFPACNELWGVRRQLRDTEIVTGLHEESFAPVPCEYLYGTPYYSVCKICETGELINLYNPFTGGKRPDANETVEVFFNEQIPLSDPKQYEVEIVDESHVIFLSDNQFYGSGESVFVPPFMMDYLTSAGIEKAYATLWKKPKKNRPDIFVTSTVGFIHDAVIQSDAVRWEKFVPQASKFDFAKTDDGKIIFCHSTSFIGGPAAFSNRTRIDPWYTLCQQDDEGGLSAKVVSSEPLTVETLQKPFLFKRGECRKMLNGLTLRGRKPFTVGVPDDFVHILNDTARQMMSLLEQGYMPYQQKQLLVETLASYGDFQPEGFGEWLLEEFSARETFSFVAIGYAIGDLGKPWQKELWGLMLRRWKTERSTFLRRVTGIAISRYDEPLYSIPLDIARIILKDISRQLEFSFDNLKNTAEQIEQQEEHGTDDAADDAGDPANDEAMELAKRQNKYKKDCRNQLQFLLSMLRLRKSEDEAVRNILHPSADMTKDLQGSIQSLMELNLPDLTVRVQGEEKKLLDEIYGFLTGARPDQFMELETPDEGDVFDTP